MGQTGQSASGYRILQARKVAIIGRLGAPICHYIQVHATVVRVEGFKGGGDYRLEVTKVGTRDLSKPIRMEFWDATHEVPRDQIARYAQVHGRKPGQLTAEEVRGLEEGYVGKQYVLLVYETGRFHEAAPEELGIQAGQMEGYDFNTHGTRG